MAKIINEEQLRAIVAESVCRVLEGKWDPMGRAAREAAFADIRKDYNNRYPTMGPYRFEGDIDSLPDRDRRAMLYSKERILKIAQRKGIELPEDEVNTRAAIAANITDYRKYQEAKAEQYQEKLDNAPHPELLRDRSISHVFDEY